MNGKKITVSAIAKQAGVSPATVSRVFNQRELVSPEKIELVENALKALGYDAPLPGPAPAKEQPVIICSMPNGNNYFYNEIIQGIQTSVNAHGSHLLMNQSPIDHGTIQDFLNLLNRVKAAGVILLNQVSEDLLLRIGQATPLVQCCEYRPGLSLPYVSIDDCKSSQKAAEYIISCGRNKIALLNGPLSFKYARDRERGFLNAIENANLTIPRSWIVSLPEINYDIAYSAVCQLLSRDPKPNAFFAVSDTLAAAVLRAAKRFHYRIPEDIIVVGFDNTEISTICTPTITTVSQPRFQMGFTSCEMLFKRIEHPDEEQLSLLLETELIIRESTNSAPSPSRTDINADINEMQ